MSSQSAVRSSGRVLLVGPYGGTNLGDDAIMTAILGVLTPLGLDVTISCTYPDVVAAMTGRNTLPLLDYRAGETRVLRQMGRFDALIIGGGQQLSEPRLPNPFWGLLARTCHMVRAARRRSIPAIVWAVGMDWPLSIVSRRLIRYALGGPGVSLLLRDDESFQRAEELLAGTSCEIKRTSDVAFLLTSSEPGLGRQLLCRELGEPDTDQRFAVLSPVNDKRTDLRYLDAMVALGRWLVDRGYRVIGWHTDLQADYDGQLRQMRDWSVIPGFAWMPSRNYSTEQVLGMLAAVDVLVTARLHPAILAVQQGVRTVGIARSSKMRQILADMKVPFLDSDSCDAGRLLGLVERALAGPAVPDPSAVERLRRLAAEGADYVCTKLRELTV